MKRASYRFGVEWIAFNDDNAEMDPEVIAGSLTVALLADMFDVATEKVAKDILRLREKVAKEQPR